MGELRNDGHIRIDVKRFVRFEDEDKLTYKIVPLQVRSKFLWFKFWTNIKVWATDDIDDFAEREAIELYNHIVYPYKYFITNADNT